MKAFLLFLFITFALKAAPPERWSAALNIVDKHEFYRENVPLTKPKDAWQLLFALTYVTRDLVARKDCVFYRVPGASSGVLKIKTLPLRNNCHDFLLSPGNYELADIKALQFSYPPKGVVLSFTLPKYKTQRWEITFSGPSSAGSGMLVSSAEVKAPNVILLAPAEGKFKTVSGLSDGTRCHEVEDNCQERSPSTCSECTNGWYETPNGCPEGPKVCGSVQCGHKNGPACRRGMKYQRVEKKFECRIDPSFAYCLPGLTIQCEGALAYCR